MNFSDACDIGGRDDDMTKDIGLDLVSGTAALARGDVPGMLRKGGAMEPRHLRRWNMEKNPPVGPHERKLVEKLCELCTMLAAHLMKHDQRASVVLASRSLIADIGALRNDIRYPDLTDRMIGEVGKMLRGERETIEGWLRPPQPGRKR